MEQHFRKFAIRGAISIEPKLSKIWKQRQMTQKFPGKVSRDSESCWISEMRTLLPKILEIPGAKLNRKKTSGKKVSSWLKSVFTHVASIYANLLEQKKAFA